MYEEEPPSATRVMPIVMGGLILCVLAAFAWVFLTQVDWSRPPTSLPDDGTRVAVGQEPMTTITSIPQFLSYRDAAMEEGQLLLVVFGATWCGACRQQEPILKRVASSLPDGARMLYVDVDVNREIFSRYSVRMLPTHLFLREGREVYRVTGVRTVGQIQDDLARLQR